MAFDGSQGVGKGTRKKQAHLDVIFRHFVPSTYAVIDNWNFNQWGASPTLHVIDLNAGRGLNNLSGVPGESGEILGSPLIFAGHLGEQSRPFWCWFCESDMLAASELQERVLQQGPPASERSQILCCDNRDAVCEIANWLRSTPGHKFGLIYADPNGTPEKEMEAITALTREFPKLDVLLHVNATNIKRCRSVKKIAAFHGRPSLLDYLERLGKKQVLVRKKQFGDGDQWTFLLATDMGSRRPIKSIGMLDVATEEGQAAIDELTWTASELNERGRKGQQELRW